MPNHQRDMSMPRSLDQEDDLHEESPNGSRLARTYSGTWIRSQGDTFWDIEVGRRPQIKPLGQENKRGRSFENFHISGHQLLFH